MVNKKSIIALCTSRIYDPQIHGFIQTLNEKLKQKNSALLVFTINADIYWDETTYHAETYVYDIIPYDEIDCLILMDEKLKSHTLANRIIRRSKENRVPVIVIDGKYEGTISLNFDYQKGFELILRHMIEHHHARRPHMMAGLRGNPFSEERIELFKKVLAENGIAYDDSMLSYGDFWADPTREATRKLLKRKTLPDAVICANDIMAMNVSAVLQEAGVRVPEDVMVSGFDGYEQIFFSTPKISSVSCDSDLMAEAAGDMALRLINGDPAEDKAILPRLIPNESCGRPSSCCPASITAFIVIRRMSESFMISPPPWKPARLPGRWLLISIITRPRIWWWLWTGTVFPLTGTIFWPGRRSLPPRICI